MAVKLASLRANLKRETDGDWVDIPDLPGLRLKTRGFNYGPYLAAKSIVDARHVRNYLAKGREVPADVLYQANARLYLDHILLDWEGLDDDGEPVPVSRAEEILTDPAFRELHDHIRYAGRQIGEVEAEFVDDAAGNSARSSAGSSRVAATSTSG
jgi:hypothetical protein